MSRPVIGIVANYYDGSQGPQQPHARLNAGYFDSVLRAGGLPVILPPMEDRSGIEQFLDSVDGVLFGGGYDIDPDRFGQPRHPKTIVLAARLEPFLFAAFELADRRPDLPVLGICLGEQLFNVARGGTLHQHVPDVARPDALEHYEPQTQYVGGRKYHPVRIEPGSRLADALGGTANLDVNSGHHQSADRLGRGLTASARSPDGIIEAIEDPSRRFFLAVQWHPEEIGDRPEQAALFRTLVEAARLR